MRRDSLKRLFAIASMMLFVIGSAALCQEEQKAPAKKKKPMLLQPGRAQTQTAPAGGGKPSTQKGKTQTAPRDPKEAGWMTVQGRVVTVHPEQRTLIIRTTTNDYQVFITSQTQVSRDGQLVKIKDLKVNDKVDSCHFNAKHVVQAIKLTSVEKSLSPQPNPSKK